MNDGVIVSEDCVKFSEHQPVGYRFKRVIDISILVSSHLILLPVFLLLWALIPILIWIGDQGPIFFRQQRFGQGGRRFEILKFRSMVHNRSTMGPTWTSSRDERITRIGKILRRTALDELPSLLNILRGDMSFVGPRALEVEEQKLLEREIPEFAQRLKVRPGLTGLAQIYDEFDDASIKIRYDLEYIRRMSMSLDVAIIIISIRNTLMAKWDRREGKKEISN